MARALKLPESGQTPSIETGEGGRHGFGYPQHARMAQRGIEAVGACY